MDILYHCLYKIDIVARETSLQEFADNDNVNNYIMELLNNISENEGDREYIFESGSITMETYLNQFIEDLNRDETSANIANRLLHKEIAAQERIARMGREIQKGILIISYVQMTASEYKIVISKADFNEFIEETSGNLSNGLPIKKKVFKAFVANVSNNGGIKEITKLVTYDLNSKKASYWTKEFLELEEVRDDSKNTLTAYKAIKTEILNPLRRKHKADWFCLWNATIAYFRSEGEFDITHYKDTIIGTYQPTDPNLNINALKEKIEKLPEKHKFDNRFTKQPKVVKDKFKDKIELSDEMDLVLKYDVANPKRTFLPMENEGRKYIAILSDEGFKYAQKRQAE